MPDPLHVLVPRWVDAENRNPQNLNAKSLLSRFANENIRWSTVHYGSPAEAVLRSPRVHLTQLLPRHLWMPHLTAWYQQNADAIFYPGHHWTDELGLRLRAACGRKVPLISTMEALVGNAERQAKFSSWAEHPVYCQAVDESTLRRIDYLYKASDHIVAISPFIAKLGRRLYGDKFSVHALGIEPTVFLPTENEKPFRPCVVNAASFQPRKRPEVFLQLAKKFPEADFVWYGDGNARVPFIEEARRLQLTNLSFPGAKAPDELAQKFQSATCFAMPSNSEGVPKVTQEAAACGLPVVIFGYYEAPTVIDNWNGFVVWDDQEFFDRVEQLISDRTLAATMGQRSAAAAAKWSWDKLAPEWEKQVVACLSS